ncbi:MAG TPA: SMC-Scp complex subunit ScpB [Thermotogota bacterium]|nr:SMC-Scp complex subunit ScpB [Thermotogota bacterium]
MNPVAAVEALLYSSKRGVELNMLCQSTGLSKEQVQQVLEELQHRYDNDPDHGVQLRKVGKLYAFYTRPEYAEMVDSLVRRPVERLTPSQLEVLAVIARKGPIKKSAVEEIRGKGSDNQILELLSTGLIRRKRVKGPGRPFVYSVTDRFFEMFRLADFELLRDELAPADEEDSGEQSNEEQSQEQ